jgi:hypothetical protein
MQQKRKSPKLTSIFFDLMNKRDSFLSKPSRFRYLLLGPNGFFKETSGAIVTTQTPKEATAFVDAFAAAQCGKALIQNGFPVRSLVCLDCS